MKKFFYDTIRRLIPCKILKVDNPYNRIIPSSDCLITIEVIKDTGPYKKGEKIENLCSFHIVPSDRIKYTKHGSVITPYTINDLTN
jgi:hypothetical protein